MTWHTVYFLQVELTFMPTTMAPFVWLKTAIIILLASASLSTGSMLYVKAKRNETCATQPCLTFNEYVNEADQYFTSNVTFVFLSGDHSLIQRVRFTDATNVTLRSEQTVKGNDVARIICAPLVNLTFVNMTSFEMKSLAFVSCGYSSSGFASAFSFYMLNHVKIIHVSFFGDSRLTSSAGIISLSNVSISNSYFAGSSSASGGALVISGSAVTLSDSTFAGNTAMLGGAIFALQSTIVFSGSNHFDENSATSFVSVPNGGAIYSILSTLEFDGTTTFARNNVTTLDYIAAGLDAVGGAVAATGSLSFNGNTSFVGNTAPGSGALYAENARIQIHGSVTFDSNTATHKDAGAFYATGGSSLYCDGNMFFHNNFANGFGGAVKVAGTNMSISGLIFQNNHAHNSGGALNLLYANGVVANSTFTNNTADLFGGAIRIDNSTTLIEDTHYSNNTAFSGGAIDTFASNVSLCGQNSFEYNSVPIVGGALEGIHSNIVFDGNITFVKNTANQGAVYGIDALFQIVGDTSFIDNHAAIGGAMYLDQNMQVDVSGNLYIVNNSAQFRGGGIYIQGNSDVRFSSHTVLQGNTAERGGGIFAIDSILKLSDSLNFENNSAQEGGALALGGSIRVVLVAPLELEALGNQAVTYGGVIFFADSSSILLCSVPEILELATQVPPLPPPDCFLVLEGEIPFDPSEAEIQLNFVNNSAGLSGIVLYGGTLDMCRIPVVRDCHMTTCHAVEYIDDSIKVLNELSRYITEDEITSNISSDPLRLCFCQDGVPNCSLEQTVSVVRGKLFTFSVVTVGQGNNTVPSSVRVDVDNIAELSQLQRIQQTGKTCTDINYQLFTPNDLEDLVLYPDGPCRDTGFARRTIPVTLLSCPDGFNLSGSVCACDERLVPFTTNCSVDNDSIEREGTFWVSALQDNGTYSGLIIHPRCPFDYCVTETVEVNLENPDVQCANNRSGILCGSCAPNLSLTLGSSHCMPCSDAYLALLIPFALAGIALVMFLLICKLTVAFGTVNGLILYANIVQVNREIFLPPNETNILTVFIAWINLDLGIETCFYDGMNTYVYTWLQFVFPFYLWILVCLIIILCHFSSTISRLFGTSDPVPVLATLLLMSYAKILHTIIDALSKTALQYPNNALVNVWLLDGNIPYFGGAEHISLAIFALFALLILFLPYTFLLLIGHKLQAFSDRRCFQWLNKIKPFIDAYYGPYKKENRYWTGFLLLVRCALFLTFAFNALGSASINLLAITSVFAGIAVIAWLSGRIYEKLYLDILEAIYIFNLCIFAVATYHVNAVGGNQAVLAYISVGIAFVTFIGTVIFHICLRIKDTSILKKARRSELLVRVFGEEAGDHEEMIDTYEQRLNTPYRSQAVTCNSLHLSESVMDS